MTKDEIKKALMKCSVDSCKDCPYDNKGLYCCGKLKRDALELINEQEREIERLKAEVKQAKINILNKAKERCDLVAEELEDEIDLYGSSAAYSCAYEIEKLIDEVEK